MNLKLMKPIIEIIVVGNEILSGRTIDKNAPYMIETLSELGFAVSFISVVGDKVSEIADTIRISAGRANVVFVTGGLGVTSDDVTVEAAASAFGLKLIHDERVLGWIRDFFKRQKRIMSESNKKQALIPEGAETITNPIGTAPGIYLPVKNNVSKSDSGTAIYLMPGVPKEMQVIFEMFILPGIKESYEPESIKTATVSVTGISESQLYDTIRHLPGAEKAFAYYPHFTVIELKIQTDKHSQLNALELQGKVIDILGDHVYSTSSESLEQVVAKMLIEKGLTVGLSESCTGGFIAHRLTNIPGSSAYMLCGVVAYSNESKHDILGIDNKLIEKYGAVSAEVVAAMAENVRKIASSDIGISTTGIAGPGGGSAEKPVGLMYAGISSDNGTYTKKLQFFTDRLINKDRMSQAVLDILRLYQKNDTKQV